MEEKQKVIIKRTERPNSYEFGKPNNRFKLYFKTGEDLEEMIKDLNNRNLELKEKTKLEEDKNNG